MTICKKHNIEKIQLWGKTIFVCTECEKQRKKKASDKLIQKNRSLLAQSHENKSKEPKNALKSKKKENTPRQKAMNLADDWFSRWVRINFAYDILTDGTVICKCYTCGSIKKAVLMQCGHWQCRGFKRTRFDERDARPQDVKCNYHRSGEPEKFEINLIKEIGQDAVNELKVISQEYCKDDEQFYLEYAEKYRIKTNELVKKLKVKKWW